MNSSPPDYQLGLHLPTPEEMHAWDAASIREFGIPELLLMENASREAFHVLNGMQEPKRSILIIMGSGNNGGDGAALARHLTNAGHDVLVCHTKPLDKLSATSREHVAMARKTGVPFISLALADRRLITPPEHRAVAHNPDLVVDALLGTGFSGTLRDKEREIIQFINHMGESRPVISIDIPSGLDGLMGLPRPDAVRATHTITFEAAKTGLALPHAREYTGTLHIREIGIPKAVRRLHPPSFQLLSPSPDAWPPISPSIHKGEAGRVLIFGGSHGLTGAPALAGRGALRAGAGLVTVACPAGIEPQIHPAFPEIMTAPLGNQCIWTNALVPACVKMVAEASHASAMVVGPGMGRSPETRSIIETLIKEKKRPPMVLDADGLYVLGTRGSVSNGASLLHYLRDDDCITPHPGEAAHLLDTSAEDVQAARLASLKALTKATRAIVVLKGAGTLIAQGNGPVFIAPFTTPSLAVGGSGDVLSGIIAAFHARIRACFPSRPDNAFRAVCLGVYAHGKAGEALDARYPHRGALAGEIADALPFLPL